MRILITGVPHSGTSCVARLFFEAGYEFGASRERLHRSCAHTYNRYELQPFTRIFRDHSVFEFRNPDTWGNVDADVIWQHVLSFRKKWELRYGKKITVWKCIRSAIGYPVLLRAWPEMKLVVVHRDLDAVRRSHTKNNTWPEAVWQKYIPAMDALVNTYPGVHVSFERLIDVETCDAEVEKLFTGCGLPVPPKDVVERAIERKRPTSDTGEVYRAGSKRDA